MTEAINYWKEYFGVEAGTVVVNALELYVIKKKIIACRVMGERGQWVVRQNVLMIRSRADVFGLEKWSDH